jgi:hypothetical protein
MRRRDACARGSRRSAGCRLATSSPSPPTPSPRVKSTGERGILFLTVTKLQRVFRVTCCAVRGWPSLARASDVRHANARELRPRRRLQRAPRSKSLQTPAMSSARAQSAQTRCNLVTAKKQIPLSPVLLTRGEGVGGEGLRAVSLQRALRRLRLQRACRLAPQRAIRPVPTRRAARGSGPRTRCEGRGRRGGRRCGR